MKKFLLFVNSVVLCGFCSAQINTAKVGGCSKVSTIQENFDGVASGVPSCWINYSDAESYVRVRAYSGTSGPAMSPPNGLYLFTYESTFGIIATPEIDNLAGGGYTLSFRARSIYSAGATIEIGYFAREGVVSSFVKLGSYTTSSATVIDNFSMDIKGVPTDVSRIVMRHTGNPPASVILDDFSITSRSLAVSDNIREDTVGLSPNPFTNIIHISDYSKVSKINIIDLSGRIVKSFNTVNKEIDLSELPTGNYIADMILSGGGHITKKIIKKSL